MFMLAKIYYRIKAVCSGDLYFAAASTPQMEVKAT